ncbi:MAG: ATPase [Candidatus Adlerbacteria bacterium]|nr:ATPase [Candidatus Adlerbacteria bacterium]
MTQEQALTILKTGANVFLTGEPGAGKTYVINRYVEWLRERGIEPAITASTGIAATHVGGMTIHAWSGVGIKQELTDWDIEALLEREPLVRRVRGAHVLIIDEVSMLDAKLLSLVDRALSSLRGSDRPFGGLQVVFVGDFFQLPPVSKNQRSQFAFASTAWEDANPLVCYLHEQHRQDDGLFLQLLGALRSGELEDEHRELLRSRYQKNGAPKNATRLYPHNLDVDRINTDALGQIEGAVHTFPMRTSGSTTLVEALKRGCLSPETLVLKVGAAVMFTRNNYEHGYVNGTLGVVEAWSPAGWPLVRTRQGALIEADQEEWRIEDGKRVLAQITQVPLRLAWAMTVHKSQGMSLDAAVMDLSGAFEYGQGYVALSRVRTLEGLFLLGFNEQALRVHPEILERDAAFRSASLGAEDIFGKLPPEDLSVLQKNFIKASGGREPEVVQEEKEAARKDKEENGSKLDKLRAKFPNAYRPWSREDDDKLTEMFREGKSVAALVKEFGRQKGSIQARLIRLGLVEPELD